MAFDTFKVPLALGVKTLRDLARRASGDKVTSPGFGFAALPSPSSGTEGFALGSATAEVGAGGNWSRKGNTRRLGNGSHRGNGAFGELLGKLAASEASVLGGVARRGSVLAGGPEASVKAKGFRACFQKSAVSSIASSSS